MLKVEFNSNRRRSHDCPAERQSETLVTRRTFAFGWPAPWRC